MLLLALNEITQARRGAAYLRSAYEEIVTLLPELTAIATSAEIDHTEQFAKVVLERLEGLRFQDKWKEIEEDMLGAYFNVPVVHIYWLPIDLLSSAVGLSAHVLTVVVLAHELAHAHTHLGSDIDSYRWETKHFAAADLDIVEGLAEFYCSAVCDRLEEKVIGSRDAFNRLQGWSAGPYLAYKRWVEGGGNPGEIVRATMIEGRRTHITATAAFEEVIDNYRAKYASKRNR